MNPNMENKDQPAFPIVKHFPDKIVTSSGLTKRELLAAMAMQTMSQDLERFSFEEGVQSPLFKTKISFIARHAVVLADALLTELEKKSE